MVIVNVDLRRKARGAIWLTLTGGSGSLECFLDGADCLAELQTRIQGVTDLVIALSASCAER